VKLVAVPVAAAAILLCGCSSSPTDEGTVKEGNGVALNPSGKPQTAEEAALADKMRQTGEAMNAQRDAEAKAMEEAKARSGGR